MRLLYVVQRYGEEVAGGAEQHARAFAERLVERDHRVTVLTTCAESYVDWANAYRRGWSNLNGVAVFRTPVTKARNPHLFSAFNSRISNTSGVRPLSVQRPHEWPRTLPPSLCVNVVYVWEVNAPPGEDPVEWRLITSEPIDTLAQVLRVVDIYRTRWLIEEFFKALKTGCAYEKRQLESLQTLLVALALLSIGVSAAFGLKYSIYGVIWRRIATTLALPKVEPEHEYPPRFAQVLGSVALILALVSFALGATTLGWGLTLAVAGLQTLLATTGYCLGCRLYFLRWWVPDLVTRIWTRGRSGGPNRTLAPEPIRYS